MFAPFSFDPQEYLKMMRIAMSNVFLVIYDDYEELEIILDLYNITIDGQDETPL